MIFYLIGAGALVCALLLLFVRKPLRSGYGAAALAVFGLACLLFGAGLNRGTLLVRYEQQPEEAVCGFFDALCAGDYEEAYSYLDNYADLGLQNEPESPEAALLYRALRESWGYALVGSAEVDGLQATQTVELRFLDLSALQASLRERVMQRLSELVSERSAAEIYDENRQYRSEVTEEVYREALDELLAESDRPMRARQLPLTLRYDGQQWRIVADSALLNALIGEIG